LVVLSDGRVHCDLCDKLFSSRNSAVNHNVRVHAAPEHIECCLCSSVFKNKFTFRNHIFYTHQIRGRDIVHSYGKAVAASEGLQ
jgi:hypothetical protein